MATPEYPAVVVEAMQKAEAYYRAQMVNDGRARGGKPRGNKWRDGLSMAWMNASYPSALQDVGPTLQSIRNARWGGPSWLYKTWKDQCA